MTLKAMGDRIERLQELLPWVEEVKERLAGLRARKPSRRDIAVLLGRLSVLFGAGIPLVECLEALETQEQNEYVRRALQNMLRRLLTGSSLASAFAAQKGLFPERVAALISLGESSGQLDSVLRELSESLEKESNLLQQVKSALTYPLILLIVSLTVLGGLLKYFIPQLLDFARSTNADLGAGVKLMFFLTEQLFSPMVLFGVLQVALALVFLAVNELRTESGKLSRDNLLLALPVVGPVFLEMSVLRFSLGLRSLLRCGCPLVASLNLLGRSLGNKALKLEIERVTDSIQEGETLGEALRFRTRFDAMFITMVAVGEEAAALPKMLNSVIKLKSEELERKLETAVALLEPLVLCLVGGTVGFVTLMFFLPMTRLIGTLQ